MSSKYKSLTNSFYLRLLLGIAMSILCIGTIWFVSGYAQLRSEAEILKNQAVQRQMELQKERVEQVISMIENERSIFYKRLGEQVRQRTLEAHAIMQGIYDNSKDKYSIEQIADLIRVALRNIRYNEGRGYFFATGLDGTEQLYPPDPQLEGTSFLGVRDQEGHPVVEDMIRIARSSGEGFYRYAWPKPETQDREYQKIAYIKYFEPLNWLVGTGEYVDDLLADLQAGLIERIEKLRFPDNGYVFVGTYQGVSLTYPAKGRNMFDVQDSNGLKIVQELIRLAQNGSGYLRYVMPALKGERPEPKISYAAAIPEWQWYVGTGDFVADLDRELAAMLSERKNSMRSRLGLIIAVLALFLLLGWYFSRRLGRQVSENFNEFQNFFDRAAQDAIPLDLDRQTFSEFHALAVAANRMVEERQKAEGVLKNQEKKFRTLFEQVSDYAIVLQHRENQMIIVDLSESACSFHGYRREELIGQPITILDPEETEVKPDDDRLKQLKKGEPIRFEVIHRRKDGSTFPAEVLIRLVEIDGQELFYSIERDLTEQKKTARQQAELEEQLRQKYKMEAVGLMAGGVAHNFNNSLAIVLGNLEMALRKFNEPDKLKDYIENAQTAVLRARDLVNQIMTYSRKGVHDRTPIYLPIVVDETFKLLRSTNPATIKLSCSMASNNHKLLINADPGRIQEALINLYTNAVHAMDEEGEIVISLQGVALDQKDIPARYDRAPGKYARLRVQDNGCGIPSDILEKIFDPFFTTKEVNIGTGMGLATVQGIVEQHEGLIKVHSRPGEGTSFELYFPLTANRRKNDPVQESEPPRGSERILFVDDEKMLNDVAEQILSELGYEVTCATEGKQALEMIKADPDRFDLILTDQTMPEMTGKELAHEIMKINSQLPVILCTGYSNKISAQDIGKEGIRAFCTKPLRLAELSVVVRQVLDQG